jgi:hypothetical protein
MLTGREDGIWTCKLCCDDRRLEMRSRRREAALYEICTLAEGAKQARYTPVKNMGQQVPRSKIFGARKTRPGRTGTGTDGVDNKKGKTASWGGIG